MMKSSHLPHLPIHDSPDLEVGSPTWLRVSTRLNSRAGWAEFSAETSVTKGRLTGENKQKVLPCAHYLSKGDAQRKNDPSGGLKFRLKYHLLGKGEGRYITIQVEV